MRAKRVLTIAALLFASLAAPGCVIVQVGVTNPIPGLTTVAISPFFNQSSERAVDGRLFAAAYYTELQKVPGFQVVPNDVTERAIIENGLRMSGPEDALELARILNVDAVVVGSITEYTPYPPPRIGLQVSWYSPYPWEFEPGIQDDVYARRRFNDPGTDENCDFPEHNGEEEGFERVKRVGRKIRHGSRDAYDTVRGQSIDSDESDGPPVSTATGFPANSVSNTQEDACQPEESGFKSALLWAPRTSVGLVYGGLVGIKRHYKDIVDWATGTDEQNPDPTRPPPGPPINRSIRNNAGEIETHPRPEPTRTDLKVGLPKYPTARPQPQFEPTKPFMSYTRLFDGADADLQATLRDYLEVRGDLRSGGWQGYLNRSEDFIRFTSHVMIVEMLTLHGGEGKRRIIFKHRKYE